MNAKDKALEIIESFRDGVLALTLFNDKEVLVKCAIIHVKRIIEELEKTNYKLLDHTYKTIGHYQQVLTELNQM